MYARYSRASVGLQEPADAPAGANDGELNEGGGDLFHRRDHRRVLKLGKAPLAQRVARPLLEARRAPDRPAGGLPPRTHVRMTAEDERQVRELEAAGAARSPKPAACVLGCLLDCLVERVEQAVRRPLVAAQGPDHPYRIEDVGVGLEFRRVLQPLRSVAVEGQCSSLFRGGRGGGEQRSHTLSDRADGRKRPFPADEGDSPRRARASQGVAIGPPVPRGHRTGLRCVLRPRKSRFRCLRSPPLTRRASCSRSCGRSRCTPTLMLRRRSPRARGTSTARPPAFRMHRKRSP